MNRSRIEVRASGAQQGSIVSQKIAKCVSVRGTEYRTHFLPDIVSCCLVCAMRLLMVPQW